nr:Phage-related tail fibre protein [uncultured Mediterranean phage uvMED]BAR25758.1 Phage-related tail fibre protein [uncultured Mediterranean phage uvMED]
MSNVNDQLKMKGKLQIRLNGEVVQEIDNIVVTAGKGYVASRMKDATATAMSHMGIGSGSTAAAASDTALGNQLGRVALTSTTVSSAVVTYVASFPAGTGTGAVTEAGILNASSGGTMLCRTVFSVVNKGASDSMTVTWTVTVS